MSYRRHSMPTRKLVRSGFLLGFLFCLAAVFGLHQSPWVPRKATVSTAQPVTLQAIKHGQAQLLHNLNGISTNQRLLLDFLQRKFDVNPVFSAKNTPILRTSDMSVQDFNLIKRIAYPDQLATTLPVLADVGSTDYLVTSAANCDHIAVPADLSSVMLNNIRAGGYDLTHVLLGLQFMTENGCPLPLSAAQSDDVVTKVAQIAGDGRQNDDLRYEATALLLYTNHPDLIKNSWIKEIVTNQLSNGGWSDAGKKGDWNDHSTTLALWTLLEYTHPHTPEEPIIRRPN